MTEKVRKKTGIVASSRELRCLIKIRHDKLINIADLRSKGIESAVSGDWEWMWHF